MDSAGHSFIEEKQPAFYREILQLYSFRLEMLYKL
jgi:hypothetical protein